MLKERLVGLLVELSHGAESRAIEEEIELLVELIAALLRPLGIRSLLGRLLRSQRLLALWCLSLADGLFQDRGNNSL